MADLLDIVDLESMLTVLAVPDGKVGLLASYITTASRNIDDFIGPVVQRTVTAEVHDGGCTQLSLRKYPVVSVTSVAESAVTVDPSGYTFDGETGFLYRTTAPYTWSVFEWGWRNVSVTYVAGRAATSVLVDELFRQATMMTVQYMWQCEQGGGGTATYGAYEGETVMVPGSNFAMPKSAFMLLLPYRQPRVSVG